MSLSELEHDFIWRIINYIYPHTYFWNVTAYKEANKLLVGDHCLRDPAASGGEAKLRSLQRDDFYALTHFPFPSHYKISFFFFFFFQKNL